MKNLGGLELIGDLLEGAADLPVCIWLPALLAVCVYLWVKARQAQRSAPSTGREPYAT